LKVTELKSKLARERQQLEDIQLATEAAEIKLNLAEYEALKVSSSHSILLLEKCNPQFLP
jgi:hypothetical protein